MSLFYDKWSADDGYSVQGEELDIDVADWPTAQNDTHLTLRLEELTHYEISARVAARERNLKRLSAAKSRPDVAHLEIHYTCCVDNIQRKALEDLFLCDGRSWLSVTVQGINGFGDLYAKPTSLESMPSLFLAMKNVKILNLHSCTLNRGHGLDEILRTIPFLQSLKELRLIGWQMDGVSILTLIECLGAQESQLVSLLSLRSCHFLGEETFRKLVEGLGSIDQLKTLNLSYCDLVDHHLVYLMKSLKGCSSLEHLHIGGNECSTTGSVAVLSDLIQHERCMIKDLNLHGLWLGFSEEGLLQRTVDISDLFQAMAKNSSLQRLTLSENYLENGDISLMTKALQQKKSGIKFLDIADNPFGEEGAKAILQMTRNCPTLESIRFENHFMNYKCTEAIRTYTRFNYVENRLLRPEDPIPLFLWPTILSSVQRRCGDRYCTDGEASDVLLRLLRSPVGETSLPLNFSLATNMSM